MICCTPPQQDCRTQQLGECTGAVTGDQQLSLFTSWIVNSSPSPLRYGINKISEAGSRDLQSIHSCVCACALVCSVVE